MIKHQIFGAPQFQTNVKSAISSDVDMDINVINFQGLVDVKCSKRQDLINMFIFSSFLLSLLHLNLITTSLLYSCHFDSVHIPMSIPSYHVPAGPGPCRRRPWHNASPKQLKPWPFGALIGDTFPMVDTLEIS